MKLPQKPNDMSAALVRIAAKLDATPQLVTKQDIAVVVTAAEAVSEALALIDRQHKGLLLANSIITVLQKQSKEADHDRPTTH